MTFKNNLHKFKNILNNKKLYNVILRVSLFYYLIIAYYKKNRKIKLTYDNHFARVNNYSLVRQFTLQILHFYLYMFVPMILRFRYIHIK